MEEDHSTLRTRKVFPDPKYDSCAVTMDDAIAPTTKTTPRSTMRRSFVKHCMEFLRCTSLHGLQYVGEKHRPLIDRIFWIISFCTSAGIASYFILQVWNKWTTSPVFVSFAESTTPVWDIPFPAITVCSEVKLKKTSVNYTSLYRNKNRTEEEEEILGLSTLLCDFMKVSVGNETVGDELLDFLNRVAPDYDDVFLDHMCVWSGKTRPCSGIFNPLITDDGVCYTFNSLPPSQLFSADTVQSDDSLWDAEELSLNWSLEDGYPEEDNISISYPRRAHAAGAKSGIQIPLFMNADDLDPMCRIPVVGFKILLHSPAEFPTLQDKYFRVPVDREIAVGVHPRVMQTSESLRGYTPERRRCFFSNERFLRYFRIYTEQNCDYECLTNYTYKHCNCVAHFMPRTKDTPVCGPAKVSCVSHVRALFSSDEEEQIMCNCMPACREMRYDLETSQAYIKWTDFFKAVGYSPNPWLKISLMNVFYNDNQFVTSKRSELYGFSDFLASCGGLLGFYLGFSILSLVEILYFSTMRFFTPLIALRHGWKNKDLNI